MEEMTMNPATWSHEQWLVVSILVFIILAIVVLVFRLFAILKTVGRKRERPNLRPGRLRDRGHDRNHEGE